MQNNKIKFSKKLKLSEFEKKIYNSNLKNFLRTRPTEFIKFYEKSKKLSMLSKERMYNIYKCLKYIKKYSIKGDIVEIGCYKGASLALCRKFSSRKVKIHGFDTFEGHQKPNKKEKDVWGINQLKIYNQKKKGWYNVSLDEVKKNIKKLSKFEKVELTKGKIQDNKSNFKNIKKISLLIIDVDWYEPTLFSLKKFYKKVSKDGFIIIDDYGHHSGSEKAVNLFFKKKKNIIFFNIDYSCIVMQKR
jgi:O-methyltransferase